ncbi:uncharacterized protein LOC119651356 isoform X2 [Hermetia illucens]|uniref:uncharacterized protein LOC119651356 isoform X2 n=1 Tax=Hermetia illucens TaxID=343691 RepID=UPI0018CC7391|nr:uncharacterized protein LOC119651356 isoform X2 [Hermetia illucens]
MLPSTEMKCGMKYTCLFNFSKEMVRISKGLRGTQRYPNPEACICRQGTDEEANRRFFGCVRKYTWSSDISLGETGLLPFPN